MPRRTLLVAALALTACIEVPPEVPPPDNPHKATAVVDVEGRTIRGGNLTLAIPAGAVLEGDRVRVTIDEIEGAPAGSLDEVYLIEPQDYPFARPVELSYRYDEDTRDSVVDLTKLFLGEARYDHWEPLAGQQHDQAARRVSASVESLGVIGLIDALAAPHGVDAGSPDGDAGTTGSDAGTPDTVAVQVLLTWDNGYDLDLHLVRAGGQAFSTTDDCYYATRDNLDWEPAGADNDPSLDIDDIDGFGPESLSIAQARGGSYSVGVHVYSKGGEATAATFTVAILVDGVEVQRTIRQADTCDQFFWVMDFAIVGGHLATTVRGDAAIFPGRSTCL